MGLNESLRLPPPFEDAISSYEREVMRFILRMTGDRDDALDLFQETWLRAYRAYPQLKTADGLRPWLYRIATNLCRNRGRDKLPRARVMAPIEIELAQPAGASGPSPGQGWDGVLHMKNMVAKLPRKQREALMMRKFGGLEYGEIATALECSP